MKWMCIGVAVELEILVKSLEPKPTGKCYCYDCKRQRRKDYLHAKYLRTHVKHVTDQTKIVNALLLKKRTIEELSGLLKINQNALRVQVSTLRKKGFNIKKICSYYRILKN